MNQRRSTTPIALVISSTSGPASGAPISSAPRGPRYSATSWLLASQRRDGADDPGVQRQREAGGDERAPEDRDREQPGRLALATVEKAEQGDRDDREDGGGHQGLTEDRHRLAVHREGHQQDDRTATAGGRWRGAGSPGGRPRAGVAENPATVDRGSGRRGCARPPTRRRTRLEQAGPAPAVRPDGRHGGRGGITKPGLRCGGAWPSRPWAASPRARR